MSSQCVVIIHILSGRDGPLLQLEYLEQYPPLLNQVGMGLLVQDYYRQVKTLIN